MAPDKDWLFQTIHQASVLKTKQSLFVIGSKRKLKLVIHSTFPSELIKAYEEIVDSIYDTSLKQFYDPSGLSEETLSKVERCLESKAMSRAKMDLHSFNINYSIWRALNVEVQGGIKFPLPKIA